jgi:alanine racemase
VEIIVLHGLIDSIETYISFDLAPAILSMEHFYNLSNQIKYWLHFDTGINRTGISKNNLSEIKNKICEKKYGNLIGAMSHLATSVVDHENKTKYQIETAKEIFVNFNCRTSMMKTLGLINEEVSCFDLIRPGHGLYFHMHEKVPTKDIGTLKSTILQIKNIKKGETVGYDCTYEAKENIIIAMINGGYANGISLKHPYVLINSKQYPVVGKVSMDMITVQIDEDVSLTDEVIILQDNWIEISSFIGQSPGSLSSVLNVNRIYV